MAKLTISHIFLLLLTLGSSTKRFQLNLIKELNRNSASSNNFAVAPLAVGQTLAMLYLQKERRRDYQLAKVLGISGQSADKVESYYSDAYKKGIKQQIMMGNRIYFPDYFEISKSMQELSPKLNVDVEKLNFTNGLKAGEEINRWLGEVIDNEGKSKLIKDEITDKTKLVAIQGISVATLWKHRFLSLAKKTFTISKPRQKPKVHNIQMMYTVGPFDYLLHDELRGVSIPFADTDISLVIFVPRSDLSTRRILENLDTFLTLKMEPMNETHLYMPSFTLRESLDLNEALKSLGIKKVFTSAGSPRNDTTPPIFKQHSILIISPNRVLLPSEYQTNEDQKVVTVNRPFVFVIQDRRNIYMAGRVDSLKDLVKIL